MMKKSGHSLYFSLEKIGKLLFVTTLISCGGGGGEGGSGGKSSSGNSNSGVKPAPIISPGAPFSQKAPQKLMSIQGKKNNYLNTYLNLTKVNAVHQQGYKGAGVKIGVIDDGNIPDIPELAGKNIVNIGDQDQADKEAHGPTVLAIIDGHTTENFDGGVAPESELFYYNLKQRWVNESGSEYGKKGYFVRSVQPEEIYKKMLEHGVKIINHSISISSNEEDPNLKQSSVYGEMLVKNNPGFIDVLKHSIHQGQLHIWAAGNSQDNGRSDPETGGLPALVPELEKGWIVVVGMNHNKTLNEGSLQCITTKAFCIGAPYSIFIPAMNGTNRSRSDFQNGTSMSSPIVSGIAALIWGKYPWMDANNVRQTLLSSGSHETPDEKSGWGLVNAEKAINGPSRFDKKLTVASQNNTAFFVANVDMAPKNWDNNSIYKKHNLKLLQSYAFNNQIVGDAGLIKQGHGPLWLQVIMTMKEAPG